MFAIRFYVHFSGITDDSYREFFLIIIDWIDGKHVTMLLLLNTRVWIFRGANRLQFKLVDHVSAKFRTENGRSKIIPLPRLCTGSNVLVFDI